MNCLLDISIISKFFINTHLIIYEKKDNNYSHTNIHISQRNHTQRTNDVIMSEKLLYEQRNIKQGQLEPNIWGIERGNCIVDICMELLYRLYTYDSDSKVLLVKLSKQSMLFEQMLQLFDNRNNYYILGDKKEYELYLNDKYKYFIKQNIMFDETKNYEYFDKFQIFCNSLINSINKTVEYSNFGFSKEKHYFCQIFQTNKVKKEYYGFYLVKQYYPSIEKLLSLEIQQKKLNDNISCKEHSGNNYMEPCAKCYVNKYFFGTILLIKQNNEKETYYKENILINNENYKLKGRILLESGYVGLLSMSNDVALKFDKNKCHTLSYRSLVGKIKNTLVVLYMKKKKN